MNLDGMILVGGMIILPFGGFLLFGITALAALVLLIVRLTRAAIIVFAAGWLAAAAMLALAALSRLHPQFAPDGRGRTLLVLAALAVLLGGVGQFVAALRSGRAYGWAVGFAAAGLLTGLLTLTVGLAVPGGVTDLGGLHLDVKDLYVALAGAGLFLSIGSLALAILVPAPSHSAAQTPRLG